MSVIQVAALLGSLASGVAAHGYVNGIIAGGVYYTGYDPSFQYDSPPPNVIGWSDPADLGNGFVQDYNSADIICHLNATNAQSHAVIAAGDEIEFQWTAWPSSHHGPVLTYLANCNGACETVDKTTLEFFTIDAVGLINDTTVPGSWATDQLIANNNSWVAQIPAEIAPGNYVIRHEILALHSAESAGGAQFYPQCMNLEITGTGTDKPTGVLGEKLYSTSAPGVLINIYETLTTYVIPGPSMIAGATTVAAQTGVATVSFAGLGATGTVAAATGASATSAASSSSAVVASSATASPSVTSTSSVQSTAAKVATSTYVAASSSSSVSSVVAPVSESSATSSSAMSSSAVTSSAVASSYVASSAVASSYTASSTVAVSAVASSSSAAVSSYIASAVVSPIASLTSALPSSLLTSTLPTAIPTKVPGAYSNTTALPTKALPEGITLEQLLEWVSYLISDYFTEGGDASKNETRAHARDLSVK